MKMTTMKTLIAVVACMVLLSATASAFTGNNHVVSNKSRQATTPRVMTSLNLLSKDQVPEKSSPRPSSSSLDGLPFFEDPKVPVSFGTIVAAYTIFKYSEYLQDMADRKSPAPAPAPPATTPAPAPAPPAAAAPKPAPVPIAVPVGEPATPIKVEPTTPDEPVAEVEVYDDDDEEAESPKKKTIRFFKFLYFPWLGMIPEIKGMISKKDD